MKRIFTAILLAALVGRTFADPASIIKQKAKDISNNNNTQQGAPPQYPASRPPAPATPPPSAARAPAIAPAPKPLTPEQQALARVVADLNVVKVEDGGKLGADLMTMARGANKPSSDTVHKLGNDLATALAGKTLTPALRTRMAQDIQAVLAGGNFPAAQMNDIIADVPAILKKAGADATASAAVGEDLKTANAEIKAKAK